MFHTFAPLGHGAKLGLEWPVQDNDLSKWGLMGMVQSTHSKIPVFNSVLLPVGHARNCQIRAIFVSRHLLRRVRGVLERFDGLWV